MHAAGTQSCVAMDSQGAEYVEVSTGCRTAMGIVNMLHGMGISHHGPVLLYEDNTAALYIIHPPYIKRGACHTDIWVHKIREWSEAQQIQAVHISTADQQADGLAKRFALSKVIAWCDLIGMCTVENFQK
jgi:hypothetical protein